MCLLPPTFIYAQQQNDPLWVKRLAEAKALAKREGFPLSLAELPKRNVPNADNAATYIRRLNEIGKKRPLPEEDMLFIHGDIQNERPLSPQQASRAKAIFASRPDVLLNIEKAAACIDYYIPLKKGFGGETGESAAIIALGAGLRSAARWLNAKTGLLLAERRNKEAIANQSKALHLARVAQQAPSLVEVLIANALNAIALRGMEKILLAAGDQPEIAQAVKEAIQRERSGVSFQNMFRCELAMHLGILEGMRKDAVSLSSTQTFLTPDFRAQIKKFHYPDDPKQIAERYINANETTLILKFLEIRSVMSAPYYQKPPKGFPSQKEMERLTEEPDTAFAYIAIPVYISTRAVLARQEATKKSIQMGAQTLAWKVKRGAFPNSLKEVISSIPLDPFDGKPLRYRKEGAGFVIYSVGETGKYDGRVFEKGRWRESVFRYPAPPQKP